MLCATATACVEDLADNDHYKPQKSTGNAWQILSSEGKYSTFLRGVELAGHRDIVDGKSILTVMAPDDNAFAAWLKDKGYSSIDEMNSKEPQMVKNLIGYHLMYYAFDWDKMVNFRPNEGDGATDEQKEQNAGLFYKHRTHSHDAIETKRVKLTPGATTDTLINIYHYERYLPVFSNKFFDTKGIDPKYNYEYFYPATTWNGGGGGTSAGHFNISNANVTDANSVITDNGYLYHVSHVLEPLNTIYGYMAGNPDYSRFTEIYDTYSTYTEADQYTNTALGYVAYIHRHGDLPPIACEWPVTSWTAMNALEMQGYNLFVPSNKALNEFFGTFWGGNTGYNSLGELDPLILKYFIMQSFSKSTIVAFPEEIKSGRVLTVYDTPINIDPDQVADRRMCANGALYGMDRLDPPAIFSSVVGPAFKDSTYSYYLYALDGSQLTLSLASAGSDFVTLMPSNEQLRHSDPAIRLYKTTSGNVLQQYSFDAGDYTTMGTEAMRHMVNVHTAPNISSLPKQGTHVIRTNTAFNYWYVKDGRITCNSRFNELLNPQNNADPFVDVEEITNQGESWSNGRAYAYKSATPFKATAGDGLAHMLAVANDKNYPYYLFAQLLQKSGLVEQGSLNTSILPSPDARFVVFIPTNTALADNIKELPGCSTLSIADDGSLKGSVAGPNKTKLAAYLRNYFVTTLNNSLTDYPYPGSSCHGDFNTMGTYKMNINTRGEQMTVGFTNADTNNKAKIANTYWGLPFAFADGCFHLIDEIMQ